jgi:hypothetical protein
MADQKLSKLKKAELVERLSKRLGKLRKDELVTLANDVESGMVDLAALARDSHDRLSGYKRPWGFQTRFLEEFDDRTLEEAETNASSRKRS